MKRFHVHVGVRDLDDSIRFYAQLFGAEPAVRKPDYAKWMLEDPRVNFAISTRSGRVGVNHLGLQVDAADELSPLRERFAAADARSLVDEPAVACCYARSDKHWVSDPQGVAWEGWHSLGEVQFYDAADAGDRVGQASACCGPASTAPAEREVEPAGCCGPGASAPARERSAAKCCG